MLFDQGASGFLDFYKFSLCVDYIWLKFNFLWPLKLTGIWTLYYLITPFLRTPLNHITRNAVFIKAIWVYMHIQHIWYERSLRCCFCNLQICICWSRSRRSFNTQISWALSSQVQRQNSAPGTHTHNLNSRGWQTDNIMLFGLEQGVRCYPKFQL